MPIYEFECNKCQHLFDKLILGNKESSPCPICGNESKKIISASNFKIKGYSEENGYAKPAKE